MSSCLSKVAIRNTYGASQSRRLLLTKPPLNQKSHLLLDSALASRNILQTSFHHLGTLSTSNSPLTISSLSSPKTSLLHFNLHHEQRCFFSSSETPKENAEQSRESDVKKEASNPFSLHASNQSPFEEHVQFSTFTYNPTAIINDITKASQWTKSKLWDPQISRNAVRNYILHLRYIHHLQKRHKSLPSDEKDKLLLSPHTASLAIQSLLRTKTHTPQLSISIRKLERLLGSLESITMTDKLSYTLLHANGKTGNIGRTLNLLSFRQKHGFPPHKYEFNNAIQSIQSAALDVRQFRNVYLSDKNDVQDPMDDPTRWLDAVLVNMYERNVPLDIYTANRMLNCFAATGRNAKATYWFYQIKQKKTTEDDRSEDPTNDGLKETKIQMKMNRSPSFSKVPGELKDQSRQKGKEDLSKKKLKAESKRDYSAPLTAAFLFADSLTHGAYGHAPIDLDVVSYNTLIKACCYRGAIWRALNIINEVMPQKGIEPDTYSYNVIMHGLARMGDQTYLKELLTTMTNRSIPLDKYTVQALVDGSLNASDVSGAITLVQDILNQHSVLPPYTSHLKIIEFALANDLVFEAKRYLFFLQQLWNRKENDDKNWELNFTKENPKIGKEALMKLFHYYGAELKEEDFKAAKERKTSKWRFF